MLYNQLFSYMAEELKDLLKKKILLIYLIDV